MLQLIPNDLELFNSFINKTDDHLLSMRKHTVYPKDEKGIPIFSSPDKKEITEPVWSYLKWNESQMNQWSKFRQRNDELYKEYKNAKGEEKNHLQQLLNENIVTCIAWDKEQNLMHDLVYGFHTYGSDREAFGFQQEKLHYKTPLRNITIHYEKQVSLTDDEKLFIEKYIDLHKQTPVVVKKFLDDIKQLHSKLPALWDRIYIAKEKADKATNSVYMPPPGMKGDFSPVVSFYVPTAEEQQQRTDDFNEYMKEFVTELNNIGSESDILSDRIYGKENDCRLDFPLYEEVDEMYNEFSRNWRHLYSIDFPVFDRDYEEYKGAFYKESKVILPAFEAFSKEQNVIFDIYDTLIGYFKIKFKQESGKQEPEEIDDDTEVEETEEDEKLNDFPISETDDLRMETIQRYESGMDSTFFDVDDWHIIMDNFAQKYDEKNMAIALEKALAQHPENATLLLRKAQEEIGKHEYQKAKELVSRAEAQGPPHHPNLYFIKADIFRQMHAPEQAILLYNKIISAEGQEELERFRERARNYLLDIYEEQKNYAECIRLSKELLEKYPDNERIVSDLCKYYRLNGMHKEAEETSKAFLEKVPESALSLVQLGHLYFEQKDFKKAAEMFEKSWALDKSGNYNDLFQAGHAYMELKRYNEAAFCYETCIFNYPLDKEFHLAAAQCYAALNMPYAANYHYKIILDLDPENTNALEKLNLLGN